MCAHLEPPYAASPSSRDLPQSERASASGLILPLFGAMADVECRRVVESLLEALSG